MGKYPHGLFTWADLSSRDPQAAKGFYEGLLGWESADQYDPDGNYIYTMFSKNDEVVAGMGEMPKSFQEQEGAPGGFWSNYINVDNVDAVVEKATANGGSVMMPATDVMTSGRMAFIVDPTGAAFGLWQAGDHQGADVFNEDGAMTWNELVTRDVEGAKAFYQAALGWGFENMPTPNGEYWVITMDNKVEGDGDRDDKFNGGLMPMGDNFPPEMPPMWSVYFQVGDADAATAKATELGGTVLMPAMDTPAGKIVVLADPHGGAFTVIQPPAAA